MKKLMTAARIQLAIMLILVCIGFSCRKEHNPINQQNHLSFFQFEDKMIKINQAIIIFNSTRLVDSIDFAQIPTDRFYKWTAINGRGCDSIAGVKSLPMVEFIFHCPGTYFVTAEIYKDSSARVLLGNSDTIAVHVTEDILYPKQGVQENDILNISLSFNNSGFYLVFSSTKLYDYTSPDNQFEITVDTSSDLYVYKFSDSILLTTYPIAYGYGVKSKVESGVDIRGITYGVPAKISVVWLGKTYEGSITFSNEYSWTTDWDNNGNVKFSR